MKHEEELYVLEELRARYGDGSFTSSQVCHMMKLSLPENYNFKDSSDFLSRMSERGLIVPGKPIELGYLNIQEQTWQLSEKRIHNVLSDGDFIGAVEVPKIKALYEQIKFADLSRGQLYYLLTVIADGIKNQGEQFIQIHIITPDGGKIDYEKGENKRRRVQ